MKDNTKINLECSIGFFLEACAIIGVMMLFLASIFVHWWIFLLIFPWFFTFIWLDDLNENYFKL